MEVKALILPTPTEINQMYSELGTSETKIEIDVKILKEWMRKQPHLPNPDDDEKVVDVKRIKIFLLNCKNSLEKTKMALDRHYTVKLLVPEYFSNWDPTSPQLIQSMKLCYFVPLPKPTHEGYRVNLFCVRTPEDADKFIFNDVMKLCVMTADIKIAKLDSCQKEILLYDMNNISMNHLSEIIPNVKKSMKSTFAAYPMRLHEVHIIYTNSILQPLVNAAKSLLKSKTSDRICVHKSIEDLKNYIDPSVLPLNYGGTYPKTSDEVMDDWYDEMTKHREWLIAQTSIVADESKRPKNSSTNLDIFEDELEGSFRKLEVD